MRLASHPPLSTTELLAVARCVQGLTAAGQLEAARRLLQALTASHPAEVWAWAALGTVAWRLGRAPEAERALCRALVLEPRHLLARAALERLGRAGARHQRLPVVDAPFPTS